MRMICVDDEPLILQLTVSMCRELSGVGEVEGFTDPRKALAYAAEHPVDLALLDIDMPTMSGIQLAKQLKNLNERTAVIFLTGYRQYAVDAFEVRASGYLMKPVNRDKLAAEVAYAIQGMPEAQPSSHIEVHTFGDFDILVDGAPVVFSRTKAKELLAYLVDRQGSSVSRPEVFAVLWEEGQYDRSKQKYLDVIIRSLRETLEKYGIDDILNIGGGQIRICPEKLDCDLYRFLDGDKAAINRFRGEYMNSYAWATVTEAELKESR